MPLELKQYIHSVDYWARIKDYVCDHLSSYTLKPVATDRDIRRLLQTLFKEYNPDEKEIDNFRRCLAGLCDGRSSISRLNIYRLLYALQLRSDDKQLVINEVSNLLLTYLVEPELNPRNLLDFIVLSSLKTDKDWMSTFALLKKFQGYVKTGPAAPDNLEEGFTKSLFKLSNSFDSQQELETFLEDEEHLEYFSSTGNTRYLALFNSFTILNKSQIVFINDYYYDDKQGKVYLTYYQMRNTYNTLFGLNSMDDDEPDPETRLDESDIAKLCDIYPSAFISLETYRSLVQRTRHEEITQGIMLLKLLEEIDPCPGSDEYINYADSEELISCTNSFLFQTGLPGLSDTEPFNALVIDTYLEVLSENPHDDSPTIKSKFLKRLRIYLKRIANGQY